MTVFSSGDAVSAVVADIGSYATKIGFAGEDYPRAYFRSVSLCCVLDALYFRRFYARGDFVSLLCLIL